MAAPKAHDRSMSLPGHGWVGLAIMVGGEALLYLGVHLIAVYFTAIMWTGYILFVDGLIWARTGSSLLKNRPREWPMLALISILGWLLFEVYNIRLLNWGYVGMPENSLARDFGYFWAFATIFPCIFLTAELLGSYRVFSRARWPRIIFSPGRLAGSFVVGLAFAIIPPALPQWLAAHLFVFVWLAFIFLLEPINIRLGADSLFREIERGRPARVWQLLLAGLLCGFLWETWNYQTLSQGGAGWLYFVPTFWRRLGFGLHFGQMPVVGFLGFIPFAWECHAIYGLCKRALQGDRLWGN